MDYDVIVNRTLKELIADVKTRTSQGWELQGGISVNANFYCQAMVKPDENKFIAGYMKGTPEMLKPFSGPLQKTEVSQTEKPKRSHKKKT